MELSAWARVKGLSYDTARRLLRARSLPLPVGQLSTGTIIIHELSTPTNNAFLQARVPSSDRWPDLDGQLRRLGDFAATQASHWPREVHELASGPSGPRRR